MTPLGRGELVAATKRSEIDSTFRVYVKEWIVAHFAPTEEAARLRAETKYGGRLAPEDIKVVHQEEFGVWQVLTNIWNVRAEWKDASLAERHKELLQEQDALNGVALMYEVVGRNSRKEHVLAQYGKLKLPDGA